MEKYRGGKTSESEVEIVDASWKLIDAEHSKLLKMAHGRDAVDHSEVLDSVEAAERILRLLFGRS